MERVKEGGGGGEGGKETLADKTLDLETFMPERAH